MSIPFLVFSLVLATAVSVPAASARPAAGSAQGYGGPAALAPPSQASLGEARQSQVQDPPTPPSDNVAVASPQAVNPDELGVSIDRIRLRFGRSALFNSVFDPSRFKLSAYVDVLGKAPPIRLFGFDTRTIKDELTSQAVPYGAPSHGEIVRMLTPQEFRTPPMDLTAIINWLAQQFQEKEQK